MANPEHFKTVMHALLNANDAASRAEAEKTARELLYEPASEPQPDQAQGDAAGEPQSAQSEVQVCGPIQPARRPAEGPPYPTLAEKTIVERRGDDDTARDSHKAF